MNQPLIKGQSLEWLLTSATDAMIIVDSVGKIVLLNPSAERMFGYEPKALLGQTIETLIPTRFRHLHGTQRTDYFDHPHARPMGIGMELFGQHRDGKEFAVEVSLSPLQTASGQQLVMATIHDITRRKAAEAAVQDSEARMRAIFETAVDAIITIDERGMVDRFNPAAERLFGYMASEVVGRNVSMLMPSPYREEHDGYLENYHRTGERRIIGIGREVSALRKDGTVIPIELAVAEMRVGDRRMFTGVVRDISERKAAEEKHKALLQEISSAN